MTLVPSPDIVQCITGCRFRRLKRTRMAESWISSIDALQAIKSIRPVAAALRVS
jgi:hypothetical protein